MKLNEAGKNEVRKLIEEQVKKIPDGQRLKLKKEILEDLIFYTVHYRENGKILSTIKYPVWTGPFLRKIDLSELSFDDVVWVNEIFQNYLSDMNIKSELDKHQSKSIDFSYTNAKIDFTKNSFLTIIENCNFEGMDFSNLTLYPFNFSSNTELNSLLIANGNNFRNTGLKIVTTNEVVNDKMLDYEEEFIQSIEMIDRLIENHVFDGCYINGQLIQNGKVTEQKATDKKEKLLSKYEQYKKDYLNSIMEQVEEQVSIFEEEHKEGKHKK